MLPRACMLRTQSVEQRWNKLPTNHEAQAVLTSCRTPPTFCFGQGIGNQSGRMFAGEKITDVQHIWRAGKLRQCSASAYSCAIHMNACPPRAASGQGTDREGYVLPTSSIPRMQGEFPLNEAYGLKLA